MQLNIEFKKETVGCWIAEVPEIPGASAYGLTPGRAAARVKTLVLYMANTVIR